ncbi:hypothetical protein GCM10027341_45500 [Spirosoma knui]
MNKLLLSFLISLTLIGCSQAQPNETPQLPSGYLYEVQPTMPGQKIYVCGERPLNSKGELVGSGDLSQQTRQVFDNIIASLKTVNMTLSNVNQVTYSVKGASDKVDPSAVQTLNAVAATYFPQNPKIVDMKSVSMIAREDILIEIEVIAVK